MFRLIWVFGFLVNGAPHIQKMPMGEMSIQDCRTIIATDVYRMHDWLRGAMQAPLSTPVAVHGECEPVRQDATNQD